MNSSNEDKIVSPASCHQFPILAPTGRRDNVKRLFAPLQQKAAVVGNANRIEEKAQLDDVQRYGVD